MGVGYDMISKRKFIFWGLSYGVVVECPVATNLTYLQSTVVVGFHDIDVQAVVK